MSRILLIVSGSIAAYKSLELASLLKKDGHLINGILTNGGERFISRLSLASMIGGTVYSDPLIEQSNKSSLSFDEAMTHINATREADIVILAPATADIIAKLANGIANDLATTTLLATNKPIIIAPAMNSQMWDHQSTKVNLARLAIMPNITIIMPRKGELACGEIGYGKMASPESILYLTQLLPSKTTEFTAIVTAGATIESIDHVRYISNYSSGKQGLEIAECLAAAGVATVFIAGKLNSEVEWRLSHLPSLYHKPNLLTTVRVNSAAEMSLSVQSQMPADIFVGAAAVGDWKTKEFFSGKIKKQNNGEQSLSLVANEDILAMVANSATRPRCVVGFAAEATSGEELLSLAKAKKLRKGCDILVANNISNGICFGDDVNPEVIIINESNSESYNLRTKQELADIIIQKIIDHLH